ncbi:prepilin-type N-terminal cleavage/methylation domain-containing protein [Clostridium butyricum]|uniref:prepilin-type N-terminal cleavage/methylation domain-containing protein n=1 Tax=Clostridium butyricum TaxID=1492 RepID=UPI002102C269|nr:prepilin-type N-terminal cleavage/methylation domain-containing protein [Clostridium butyricum]MCQ2012346.1 prepilin-type N-terminal cleavage/methylation domain-containing protein [Clostridium butyricum]MCQ2024713.1 prepilin-type N-terminal cleavage/methylation domain-containing protein [Clostridium butyricum]
MNQLGLKKKNELMKKKKGFTLVELIIVIAVIAVLAAVAIPKFGAVKKDANLSADKANAKIIATAVASAIADGTTVADGPVASSVYASKLDGGALPKPKTTGANSFKVSYTVAGGTVVTLVDSADKAITIGSDTTGTVYPEK